MYAQITRNPQVVQQPTHNDCLKVIFDYQTEPQLVPKLSLHVSVRELNNSLVIDPNDGGLKDPRDKNNNINISDYTFRSLLPPQLKHISARYKVICSCECCISDKSIHSSFISWCDEYLKKLKIKSKILKSEGQVKNHITHKKHIKIQ